jgi:ubiquinone/menaquinone biosynthesis C-methylase UbiE
MEEDFYVNTLKSLVNMGRLTTNANILVVAGGTNDRDSLLAVGFSKVVVSNLDTRMIRDQFLPYDWSFQDAESLTYGDEEFDVVVTHQALHHCLSPHRALLELYRVAKGGILVFEPRDSLIVRLCVKLGYGQVYETEAVDAHGGEFGGVRNSSVPNFIFRWTEREVEKAIRCAEPRTAPRISYFYSFRGDLKDRLSRKGGLVVRSAAVPLAMMASFLAKLAPKQTNCFAFFVEKPRLADPAPWANAQKVHPCTPHVNEKL